MPDQSGTTDPTDRAGESGTTDLIDRAGEPGTTCPRHRRQKAGARTFGTWFPAFCACGQPITQAVRDAAQTLRGRPRLACSDRCLRQRQRALRKLRVRQRWLQELLTYGREGKLTAPELVEQLDALLADIAEARALIVRDDPEVLASTRRQT